MLELPWYPMFCRARGLGDLAEVPPDIVIIKRRADGGGGHQIVVLPQPPGSKPVSRFDSRAELSEDQIDP